MKDKVWAEKYRPKTLDEYIYPKSSYLKDDVENWVKKGVFPNLVLAGIQGTGKSTLASVLINEFEIDKTDVLHIDGSVKNKIEHTREIIIPFCDYSPMGSFKVVLIEEAHRLTHDSQAALLDTMEKKLDSVRFIFTTNFPKKLLPALLSRTTSYIFDGNFDEEAAIDRIAYILENEGYGDILEDDHSAENVIQHVEAFKPDMRSIISSIQNAIRDDRLNEPKNSIRSSSIDEWEQLWQADELDYDRLMEMVLLVDGNNFESFYTTVYEKGLHHFSDEQKGEVVVQLSEYLSKSMNGATQGIQSIHLEAFLYTIFNYIGEDNE